MILNSKEIRMICNINYQSVLWKLLKVLREKLLIWMEEKFLLIKWELLNLMKLFKFKVKVCQIVLIKEEIYFVKFNSNFQKF